MAFDPTEEARLQEKNLTLDNPCESYVRVLTSRSSSNEPSEERPPVFESNDIARADFRTDRLVEDHGRTYYAD